MSILHRMNAWRRRWERALDVIILPLLGGVAYAGMTGDAPRWAAVLAFMLLGINLRLAWLTDRRQQHLMRVAQEAMRDAVTVAMIDARVVIDWIDADERAHGTPTPGDIRRAYEERGIWPAVGSKAWRQEREGNWSDEEPEVHITDLGDGRSYADEVNPERD